MLNPIRIDVLAIQEIVAAASPSAWLDGLVTSVAPGTLTVALLDGDVRVLGTRAAPRVGEPVAVHPVADIVCVDGAWYHGRPVPDEETTA